MIILLLILLLFPIPTWATTYYVATTGSDTTGDGSSGNPWATPNKASSSGTPVRGGDTVIVRDGTYSDTDNNGITVSINSNIPSSSGNPVTYKSENYRGAVILVDSTADAARAGFYITRDDVIIEGFDINDNDNSSAGTNTSIHAIVNTGFSRVIIRRNWIHKIARSTCSSAVFGFDGILIQGGQDNVVEENLIHTIGRRRVGESSCNLTPGGTGATQNDHAIYAYNTTRLHIIHNVIYDTTRGWHIHIYKSGGQTTTDLLIANNTMLGTTKADSQSSSGQPLGHILLAYGQVRTLIKNNVSYGDRVTMINLFLTPTFTNSVVSYNRMSFNENDGHENFLSQATPSGMTVSNNTDNSTIGFLNVSCTNSDGSCENASATLVSGANSIDAGTDVGLAYNGTAPDQGAFETFKFSSCQVPNGAANTIQITFENNAFPPIGSTITTFTARKNLANNALTGAATKVGDNIASLPLTNSYPGTADISWASGGLTDQALIGGTLNQPFVQVLTNQSCTDNSGGAPAYTFTQAAFEFHDARGLEAAPVIKPDGYASSGAAENYSNLKVRVGGSIRIRFAVVCGGADCASTGFLLRYSTGGAYAAVPDTMDAGNVKSCGVSAGADNPSNGSGTTNQLSTAGTFVTGGVVFTSNAVPTVTMTNGYKTELEYCVMFDTDASGTYTFRVYQQDGTALNTYTATPSVVLTSVAAGGAGF